MSTTLYGTKGGLTQKNINGGYDFVAEINTEEGGNMFTKKLASERSKVSSSYHEFINSIIEKRKPMATAEQGVKVMKILDALYLSAKTGKEVICR